jgi:hypothetical protein
MNISNADTIKIRRITSELQKEHDRLRAKFKFLKFQNFIGSALIIFSVFGIILSSYLWFIDVMSTIYLVLTIAFWNSILHELEHDLIHGLYFKKVKFIHNMMLFTVWIFRPLTLNPWIRTYWHYNHHQHSGQKIDIEERGVTNGEKWSFLRLLITPDLVLGFLLRLRRLKKEIIQEKQNGNFSEKDSKKLKSTVLFGMLPFGIHLHLLFYFWIILNSLFYFASFSPANWSSSFFEISNPVIYIFVLPNIIRQFCLHLITSNMHYYGDIQEGNILQQTQVLNRWWTWPFQLFCFNFGSTHSIHHFVVNEPFYLRQMSMKKSHQVFKQEGIRFNDTTSFKNANHYWPK